MSQSNSDYADGNYKKDNLLFQKATKLRDEGKFKEALNIIALLLPKYPENQALLATAARLNWETGNIDTAINLFNKCVSLNPKSESFSLGLFHCLWEKGKKIEALEEAKRFMSISFSNDYVEIVREINKGRG